MNRGVRDVIQSDRPYRFEAMLLSESVTDPLHWDLLSWRLPAMQEHAAEYGYQFTDDEALTVQAVQARDGEWVFTPGLTTYYRWAVSAGGLDHPLSRLEADHLPGTGDTLRTRLGIRYPALAEMAGFGIPAKAGCGAAVVTTDNQLVLGVRNRVFVAGGSAGGRAGVHVVAEGMLAEDIGTGGIISPAAGARRGLLEELAITRAEIVETGLFLDQVRVQPVFGHIAYVPLTFTEVQHRALGAHDGWEADRLVSMPFEPGGELKALADGDHPEFVVASNQAGALIDGAMAQAFGAHRTAA